MTILVSSTVRHEKITLNLNGEKTTGNCHSRSGVQVKSVSGTGEISVANIRIYPINWVTLKSSAAGLKTVGWVTYYWAPLKSLAAGKNTDLPR